MGKSTTATNLAAGLARAEHRSLLIDADAQGHATYWFANEDEDPPGDLYAVIKDGMPTEQAIMRTRIDGLDLLPATLDLAALDLELVSMTLREYRLKKALEPVAGAYAYAFVVIDLPPSLSLVVLNALAAADFIIAPVSATWRRHVWRHAAPAGSRPRDLRSSYITTLIYAGRPLTEIAKHAGTSVAMIDRHYAGVIANWDGAPVPAETQIQLAREARRLIGGRSVDVASPGANPSGS